MSVARYLQKTAIALVAHQRLVPLPQLRAQRRHDRRPVGPVLLGFVLVDAHDVTPRADPNLFHLQRRRVGAVGTLGVDHAEPPPRAQHLLPDFVAAAHAGAQDVRPALRLQVVHRLPADHAPVGHDADLDQVEAAIQPVDNGNQRLDVGGIARPHFTAQRPAVTVEHGADDHLLEVRPVVFAMAVLAQLVAALTLEVDRGGVEENHLDAGEQITPALEQAFLDAIHGAQGNQAGRPALLVGGQRFSQPGHGAVEVVQLQPGGAVEGIVRLPLSGGAIAAGLEQAVQDGEEHGAFDIEAEAAVAEESADHGLPISVAPQAFEDDAGAEPLHAEGGQCAVVMGGEEERLPGEAGAGGEEAFQSAVLLEVIEAAERGHDALVGTAVGPVVLDDLEVLAWSGRFDAEEHGSGPPGATPWSVAASGLDTRGKPGNTGK